MSYQNILVEIRDAVGLITLNRPQVLNAANSLLMQEMGQAIDDFERDPAIGAIVITGSERAFAAGADIKEMSSQSYADAWFVGYTPDYVVGAEDVLQHAAGVGHEFLRTGLTGPTSRSDRQHSELPQSARHCVRRRRREGDPGRPAEPLTGGERPALGVTEAVEIRSPDVLLAPVSRTFHGRDVFAPAAAHLAAGAAVDAAAPPEVTATLAAALARAVRDLVFDDTVAEIYLGPTLAARLRARFSANDDRGAAP